MVSAKAEVRVCSKIAVATPAAPLQEKVLNELLLYLLLGATSPVLLLSFSILTPPFFLFLAMAAQSLASPSRDDKIQLYL